MKNRYFGTLIRSMNWFHSEVALYLYQAESKKEKKPCI